MSNERLWAKRENVEEKVVPLAKPASSMGDYVAFEVRDHAPPRLRIELATRPARYPGYNYLLDIVHEHHFDTLFTLVYSFMSVEVTGQRLGDIVKAISAGHCVVIREHHAELFGTPSATGPLIEAITITEPGAEEAEPA